MPDISRDRLYAGAKWREGAEKLIVIEDRTVRPGATTAKFFQFYHLDVDARRTKDGEIYERMNSEELGFPKEAIVCR